MRENGQIHLIYEDDGIGISSENKPRLFSEGFSTNQGTGLGLSMLRKIMQVYGWTITEVGEPGKGARFVIGIPESLAKVSKIKN